MSGKLYGYHRKVADINLSLMNYRVIELPEYLYKAFIGGSGLGVALLIKYVSIHTDPYGSDNTIIYLVGPLTGTLAASTARFAVVSKSPLTNLLAEGTAGGRFGPLLKKSGFDALIIRGKADKPIFILAYDGYIEFKDASSIWGLDTFEATDIIKRDLGLNDIEAAVIGPAGENLVRYASIVCEKGRLVGRLGQGAVMGSKNLKAVVVGGERNPEVFDDDKLRNKYIELVKRLSKTYIPLRVYGTQASVASLLEFSDTPVKNWSLGMWEEGQEKFNWDNVNKTYRIRRRACPSCPIACEGVMEHDEEGRVKAPEYETMAVFGPMLLIDDLKAIADFNILVNKLGLDSISTGSAIAFAMEAYEKGYIDESLGIIRWGSIDDVRRLILDIAYRRGKLAYLLGEGVSRAANLLGAEELAVTVKGLEVPMHDPRAAFSSALMYATQPRGGSHTDFTYLNELRGLTIPEIGVDRQLDRFTTVDKADLVIKMQNLSALADSLVFCKFGLLGGITVSDLIDFIRYVTGWDINSKWIHEVGSRLFNLKRLFNIRLGVSNKDDKLPKKLLTPLKEGSAKDMVPDLNKMLKEYYKLRKWDERGYPTREAIDDILYDYLPDDYKILIK